MMVVRNKKKNYDNTVLKHLLLIHFINLRRWGYYNFDQNTCYSNHCNISYMLSDSLILQNDFFLMSVRKHTS